MRDFCLLLLLFCAFAEAYWEEKNWWWDTLWEEEWLEEEPGEVSSGDPAAKKYSRIGFDATWRCRADAAVQRRGRPRGISLADEG